MKEEIIGKFGSLVLTTNRLRQMEENQMRSALLENVEALAVEKNSQPIWAIIAAIAAVLGLMGAASEDDGGPFVAGLIVGGICLFIYFATKNLVFAVYAGGMKMVNVLSGNPMDEAKSFINSIEAAKRTGSE
jgi:hypothetical protein